MRKLRCRVETEWISCVCSSGWPQLQLITTSEWPVQGWTNSAYLWWMDKFDQATTQVCLKLWSVPPCFRDLPPLPSNHVIQTIENSCSVMWRRDPGYAGGLEEEVGGRGFHFYDKLHTNLQAPVEALPPSALSMGPQSLGSLGTLEPCRLHPSYAYLWKCIFTLHSTYYILFYI